MPAWTHIPLGPKKQEEMVVVLEEGEEVADVGNDFFPWLGRSVKSYVHFQIYLILFSLGNTRTLPSLVLISYDSTVSSHLRD